MSALVNEYRIGSKCILNIELLRYEGVDWMVKRVIIKMVKLPSWLIEKTFIECWTFCLAQDTKVPVSLYKAVW